MSIHVEDIAEYTVPAIHNKALLLKTRCTYIVQDDGRNIFRIEQDNQDPELPPDVILMDRDMLAYLVERTRTL